MFGWWDLNSPNGRQRFLPKEPGRRFLAKETMRLLERVSLPSVSPDGPQLSEANSREGFSPAQCDAMLKRQTDVGAE
jgi:hypothetical protein